MKKVLTFITLLLTICLNVQCQKAEVHKNDGTVVEIPVEDIDSITFSMTNPFNFETRTVRLNSGYNIATNITTDPWFNQVLGFSEPEVRSMLDYYRPLSGTELTTDEMLDQMRPWYDNYCFAELSLKTDPKMFNSNMVTYYVNTLLRRGTSPDSMEDPNAKTDYTKLRQLIRLDTIDSYRRGIVHRIAQDGYIYSKVKDYFPAIELVKKENFISLLYYYGMITMTGTYQGEQRLGIPNNNVRRQHYDFLLDEFQRASDIDTWELKEAFRAAAYDGEWRALLGYIADSYREDSAVRSAIEGERHLQGYFLAFLNMYQGYLTAPEVELNPLGATCQRYRLASPTATATSSSCPTNRASPTSPTPTSSS